MSATVCPDRWISVPLYGHYRSASYLTTCHHAIAMQHVYRPLRMGVAQATDVATNARPYISHVSVGYAMPTFNMDPGSGILIDNVNPLIIYGDGWFAVDGALTDYNRTINVCGFGGSSFTFNFTGVGIAAYSSAETNNSGLSMWWVDRSSAVTYNVPNSGPYESNLLVYQSPTLPYGPHVFDMECPVVQNANRSTWVFFDYLEYFSSEPSRAGVNVTITTTATTTATATATTTATATATTTATIAATLMETTDVVSGGTRSAVELAVVLPATLIPALVSILVLLGVVAYLLRRKRAEGIVSEELLQHGRLEIVPDGHSLPARAQADFAPRQELQPAPPHGIVELLASLIAPRRRVHVSPFMQHEAPFVAHKGRACNI
ncbi:hypothetical protein PsYK624_055390 [Phanerochaete sordida]|uniref:Uncharacterized protein n=1 Tax=Phanerochaete sordida TaxID=48140 RepID=A0A9P3G6Z3_9APHY|nr:hypothetical protein PsYK624_055390 [Phanerochaete sordida]